MRTDLAKESRSHFPDIGGIEEQQDTKDDVEVTRIRVCTEEASKKLDKPIGRYITLTVEADTFLDRDARAHLSRCIADELALLIPKDASVLIIGLGNRYITADALGTKTAEYVFVTRHIQMHLADVLPDGTRTTAALCTGVLGVTGMETAEVVQGLIERIKPQALLIIDSLAAGDVAHIGTVVQINDSGIAPGAGIGNFRAVLNQESLHIPVVALGIPLVVSAETIVQACVGRSLPCRLPDLLREMIVTPKDIDAMVRDAARVLSDGINLALHGDNYTELEELLR